MAIVLVFVSVGCSIRERVSDEALVTIPKNVRPAVPVARETLERADLKNAYFDYDQAILVGDAKQALLHDAQWLRQNPDTRVQIEGYCDERGSYDYNLSLGQRRADAVKKFLVAHGISESRLVAVGVGKIPGVGDGTRARNRRAGFVMLFDN